MSSEMLLKGFFALIFSGMFAWAVMTQDDVDRGADTDIGSKRRYSSFVPGIILPVCMLVIYVLAVPTYGPYHTLELSLSTWFAVFLHISMYYALLLPLLPLLRKRISARACATLWMLPNFLYLTQHEFMGVDKPAFVLKADRLPLKPIAIIWAVGFCAIMFYKFAEHFVIRRRFLKHSKPLINAEALEVWRSELENANIKKARFKPVISPDVTTPLSIGFFSRTIRVILPEKDYSPEELKLIFRHELIHISREDSFNKLFLVFCTALCWFNPLMWKAMRRSAEDMELSCDETVLLEEDIASRRKYAELLLSTAASEKGFTTCLSSGFKAMKYRLKNIISPGKRTSGAIITGVTFFILTMTCGYFAVSYDSRSGSELIFDSDPSGYVLSNTSFSEELDRYYAMKCRDPEGLISYLSEMTFSKMTGSYTYSSDDATLLMIYERPAGNVVVKLTDNVLTVTPLYDESLRREYIADTPPDWDHLKSMLVFPG